MSPKKSSRYIASCVLLVFDFDDHDIAVHNRRIYLKVYFLLHLKLILYYSSENLIFDNF